MRFVGVDLAWGTRRPTGVCVVEGGRVVDSALLRTDEELRAWLRPVTAGPCVVGVDAPLIVRNPSGSRPCEQALNRCFARFEAGCHPSNTSLVPLPRAELLARDLRLRPEPFFPPRAPVRRIVEVYPHAALVALFGLQRTIKYKAKRGRTIADRHAAFAQLLDCLEGLASLDPAVEVRSAPRWEELATTVSSSGIGAALDRAEDELDAFLCAYIAAHLWEHGPSRNRVVGDAATGFIVTPVDAALARCLDGARAAAVSRRDRSALPRGQRPS